LGWLFNEFGDITDITLCWNAGVSKLSAGHLKMRGPDLVQKEMPNLGTKASCFSVNFPMNLFHIIGSNPAGVPE